jgi:hypothetical protein
MEKDIQEWQAISIVAQRLVERAQGDNYQAPAGHQNNKQSNDMDDEIPF